MTDFEKKIRLHHNKKMKYNKDVDALFNRLRRKEADKYDFDEEKVTKPYYSHEKTQKFPHKPNRKARVLSRVIITLLIILLILIITMWVRYRFPESGNSIFFAKPGV